MEPEIVPQPAIRLLGLELRTRAMSHEIPVLWPRLVTRLSEIAGEARRHGQEASDQHAATFDVLGK